MYKKIWIRKYHEFFQCDELGLVRDGEGKGGGGEEDEALRQYPELTRRALSRLDEADAVLTVDQMGSPGFEDGSPVYVPSQFQSLGAVDRSGSFRHANRNLVPTKDQPPG